MLRKRGDADPSLRLALIAGPVYRSRAPGAVSRRGFGRGPRVFIVSGEAENVILSGGWKLAHRFADVGIDGGPGWRGGYPLDKTTKCCELDVRLKNGHRVVGRFHISARTSSTIRPSDALMDPSRGMLLLTEVSVFEGTVQRAVDAVVVPLDAVAYIELPRQWSARPEPEGDGRSMPGGAALQVAGLHPAPPAAGTGSSGGPPASKWLRPPNGAK